MGNIKLCVSRARTEYPQGGTQTVISITRGCSGRTLLLVVQQEGRSKLARLFRGESRNPNRYLIGGRLLRAIDHQHIGRSFHRVQLQAKLFLDCCEQARCRIVAGWNGHVAAEL